LKSGHIPPEQYVYQNSRSCGADDVIYPHSKIESYIRSKYESRRWALDGPPPADPSILEQAGDRQNIQDSQRAPASTSPAGPSGATTGIAAISQSTLPTAVRQPQTHQLLSANFADSISNNEAAHGSLKNSTAEVKISEQASGDLFSLDFHVPPVSMTPNGVNSEQPKKDAKDEILSLFSASNVASTTISGSSASAHVVETRQPTTSMMGTNGVGLWGTGSGWTGPPMTTQQSSWGNLGTAPPPQPSRSSLFNTSDVWQMTSSSQNQPQSLDFPNTATTNTVQHTTRKDDLFGDLWG
jgi:stromal membrane-associated protein